jgi:hypothetical protein
MVFGVNGTTNSREAWIQVGHDTPANANSLGNLLLNPLGGFVGIRTSSPGTTYELYVGGDIGATGDVVAFVSDERLKTKEGVIENPLDKINLLNGFYYRFNEKAEQIGIKKSEERKVGVSAQEVQKVLPEAVKRAPADLNEEGGSKSGEDYLTVQYEKIIPLLIEGIKELKQENDTLRQELDEIKKILKL